MWHLKAFLSKLLTEKFHQMVLSLLMTMVKFVRL